MTNEIFEFMTLAFPKAGVQVGVPITVAMLLFCLALAKSQYQVVPAFLAIKGLPAAYLVFVFVVCVSFIFNMSDMTAFNISVVMVVIGSPLALAIGRAVDPQKAMELLTVSLIIVGFCALIQRVLGITHASIPGVTYTLGQDLADKPIGYGMASSGDAQKMPSTYQNGNGAGLFYALAIPILLAWRPEFVKWQILRGLAVLLGFIGLLLSGSRSILIPFCLFFLFIFSLLKNKLTYRRQILFLAVSLLVLFFTILYLMQAHSAVLTQLYSRYVSQTVSDPTGSDRTVQYGTAFSQIQPLTGWAFVRFLCIGLPWSQIGGIEGFLSTLFMYGLFGFLAFIASLFVTAVHIYRLNKLTAIGFLCVFIAFMVDGSFNYPPGLMNFFFLAGLLSAPDRVEANDALLQQPFEWLNWVQRRGKQWKLQ